MGRIFFIHGTGCFDPRFTWSAQRPLGDVAEVVVVHRAGYGDNARMSPATVCSDAERLVTSLGVGAHVVGASTGALVALHLAALVPARIKSLTLIEPAALSLVRGQPAVEELVDAWSPFYASREQVTPDNFFRGLVRMIGGPAIPEHFRLPSAVRAAAVTAMREAPPWTVQVPLTAVVAARIPVLVVTGGWHPAFEAVAERIERDADARRVVLAGAGHEPQRLGDPFNAALLQFLYLSTHSRGGSARASAPAGA